MDIVADERDVKGCMTAKHAKCANIRLALAFPCCFEALGIRHLGRSPRQSNPVQPCFFCGLTLTGLFFDNLKKEDFTQSRKGAKTQKRLPLRNTKNAKKGVCFLPFCDPCDPSRRFGFGCSVNRLAPWRLRAFALKFPVFGNKCQAATQRACQNTAGNPECSGL